jgi:hypothetical protein
LMRWGWGCCCRCPHWCWWETSGRAFRVCCCCSSCIDRRSCGSAGRSLEGPGLGRLCAGESGRNRCARVSRRGGGCSFRGAEGRRLRRRREGEEPVGMWKKCCCVVIRQFLM